MRPERDVLPIVAPIALYLTVLLLVAALLVKPSALGWVGFGLAAAIGLSIGAVAVVLFPRARANGVRLHPVTGDVFKLLVVVDAHCERARLREAVRSRVVGRGADVLIVAPVLASARHFFAEDEEREREDARARLTEALQALDGLGIESRGVERQARDLYGVHVSTLEPVIPLRGSP